MKNGYYCVGLSNFNLLFICSWVIELCLLSIYCSSSVSSCDDLATFVFLCSRSWLMFDILDVHTSFLGLTTYATSILLSFGLILDCSSSSKNAFNVCSGSLLEWSTSVVRSRCVLLRSIIRGVEDGDGCFTFVSSSSWSASASASSDSLTSDFTTAVPSLCSFDSAESFFFSVWGVYRNGDFISSLSLSFDFDFDLDFVPFSLDFDFVSCFDFFVLSLCVLAVIDDFGVRSGDILLDLYSFFN